MIKFTEHDFAGESDEAIWEAASRLGLVVNPIACTRETCIRRLCQWSARPAYWKIRPKDWDAGPGQPCIEDQAAGISDRRR